MIFDEPCNAFEEFVLDTEPPPSPSSSMTVKRPFCTEVERERLSADPPAEFMPPAPPFASSSSMTVNRPFCSTRFSSEGWLAGLAPEDWPPRGELNPELFPDPGALPVGSASPSTTVGSLSCSSRVIAAASARMASMSKSQRETPLRYSALDRFSSAASVEGAELSPPAATAAARCACLAFSRSFSLAVRSPSVGIPSSRCLMRKSVFLASLRNLCSSSLAALGRLDGSFWRQMDTKSRSALEKWWPLSACSASSCGGGFCRVISRTFIGGYLANGAWPWHSSSTVMPRLQISACQSYPATCSITSGAIQHGVPTKVAWGLAPEPQDAAETPKSPILTDPLSSMRMLPALTSRWMLPLRWK
mmetsp:Transcript_11071/g.51287  ORF Transcript_11071/g.51287 Transcript_11071/m.51287 type:complete len:361 (+) Transcript_11071:682-1764(+)